MAIIATPNVIAPAAGVDSPFRVAGAPVDGVSGSAAGKASTGALLVNTVAGTLFQNTGTISSPTWVAR